MYKEQLSLAIEQTIQNDFERFKYCEYVKKRQKDAGCVCLYGTGKFFNDYIQNIKNFDYVCDSNSEKWGKVFAGRQCISPEQLLKLKNVVVFIMVGQYKEISKFLTKKGIENYYFGDLYLNIYDEQYSKSWFKQNKEHILNALDYFEDDWSKKVYTNIICNRIAPEYSNMSFHDLEEQGEYFSTGILKLTDSEYFVDCGAYNGDSIKSFIKSVNGKFKAIYGFEFDSTNFNQMLHDSVISSNNKIELFNFGVSDKEDEIFITSSGTGSHISKNGKNKVKLYPLDKVLHNKNVTFIKMDIEGSEKQALIGAKEIIKEQKPKLAISVYHKLDDLWKIPCYIKKLNNSYKLKMRHHTAVVWDTNCYAYIEE